MACRSNGKYFGPLRSRNNEASELRHGTFVTPRETSSYMVLGVEVDGIADYPVGDKGSGAARGTASDLGG